MVWGTPSPIAGACLESGMRALPSRALPMSACRVAANLQLSSYTRVSASASPVPSRSAFPGSLGHCRVKSSQRQRAGLQTDWSSGLWPREVDVPQLWGVWVQKNLTMRQLAPAAHSADWQLEVTGQEQDAREGAGGLLASG